MGAVYRIRQFIAAIRAKVQPDELAALDQHLTAEQKQLFLAMELQDQRHSLNVFYHLVEAGYSDKALLQAALLHDVGKAGVGLGVFHRTLIVLLRALCPQLLSIIASPDPQSWGYPFWVHRHHGELGAELVARAGGSDKLVALIRYHQRAGEDPLARALYIADSANLFAKHAAIDLRHSSPACLSCTEIRA